MIVGVHHLSILISSEQSLNFYKMLGFSEIFRKQRQNDIIVLLEGFGIQVEAFVDSRHPFHPKGLNEPLGCRHMALKTDNIEKEVSSLNAAFLDAGFEAGFQEIGFDWTGERYIFFSDPDGNLIELHE